MPKQTFVCEYCGKPFEAYHYGYTLNRFCSKPCRFAALRESGEKRTRVTCTCAVCGKTIERKAYHYRPDAPNYCSLQCFGKSLEQPPIEKTCPNCGKVFNTTNKNQLHCSIQCHNAALAHKRDRKIVKTCPTCGKEFRTKRSENLAHCSYDCARKDHSINGFEYQCYTILDLLNVPYQKQIRLGKHFPDAYIPCWKLAVCFDGDYWHSKPEHIARDNRFAAYCQKNGYGLVRIFQSEFTHDPMLLIRRIEQLVGCSILEGVAVQMPLFQDLNRYVK